MAAVTHILCRATDLDLTTLLSSWQRALKAERKSPATIQQYTIAVQLFIRWCEGQNVIPAIDRVLVQEFVADLLDKGAAPSTAVLRQQAVRQFSRWLTDEGELPVNPLLGLKAPKVDVKVVQCLTEDELKLLLKQCSGKDFRAKRDEAAIRIMAETGMRAGECVGLTVDDLDLCRGLVTIRRGKGGRGRIVPVGALTVRSLDRYIRARRTHRLADSPALWLGDNSRGGVLSYHGVRKAIMERAEAAGLDGFHLHRLRHTFASRWLGNGGSEGGLMAVAGWKRREMIDRYVAATAQERAAAEARALNLGDL